MKSSRLPFRDVRPTFRDYVMQVGVTHPNHQEFFELARRLYNKRRLPHKFYSLATFLFYIHQNRVSETMLSNARGVWVLFEAWRPKEQARREKLVAEEFLRSIEENSKP